MLLDPHDLDDVCRFVLCAERVDADEDDVVALSSDAQVEEYVIGKRRRVRHRRVPDRIEREDVANEVQLTANLIGNHRK